jgi:hypothetical protein
VSAGISFVALVLLVLGIVLRILERRRQGAERAVLDAEYQRLKLEQSELDARGRVPITVRGWVFWSTPDCDYAMSPLGQVWTCVSPGYWSSQAQRLDLDHMFAEASRIRAKTEKST